MINGEIQYGAKVVDQSGEMLGTIDHLIRNLKTWEVGKVIVRRKGPEKDLFLTIEDILEMSNGMVKLNTSFEELKKR